MKLGTEEKIIKNIRAFVKNQMKKLDALILEHLVINPFLVGTLNFKKPEEVVEFFVNQRFQRSIVTAFGGLLEKRIARLFGEEAGIADIDLKFTRNGKIHYMQMKSGPEGFTGPALTKTINKMIRLKKENPDIITIIGFAYGTREKLSPVWGPTLLNAEKEGEIDKVLVGREFWEFVLEDPNGYKIIFDIFRQTGLIGERDLTGGIRNLEKARKDAYERVLKQFKEKYGEGSESIQKMIEDNL